MKRWLSTAGLILTAIVLALAGAKAAKKRESAIRKDKIAVDLMNSGTSKQIAKGKKLRDAANKDKDAAIAADAKTAKQLEKMGASNNSIDTIANRFNSRRLRRSG